MSRPKIELTPSTDASATLELTAGPSSTGINTILLRKGDDTRPLNAAHVVMLAESISILGLLEPIVVDVKGHLLAGAHRLAALQLLTIGDVAKRQQIFLNRAGHEPANDKELPKELKSLADRLSAIDLVGFTSRHPKAEIAVVVIEVSGKDAKVLPLAIEAAENNVRRQYNAEEIKVLAARYAEAGYTVNSGGRPKKGEKTVLGALEAALGRSKRQIQRIISPGKVKRGKTEWGKALAAFKRAAQRVADTGAKKEGDEEKALVGIAERAAKAVDKLGAK